MESKLTDKAELFLNALSRLKEAAAQDNKSDIVIDAIIQRFEFTVELTWKFLKEYLEEQGIAALTPKEVMREAFAAGIIKGDDNWLRMLKDRNLTSHTYNEELAQEIHLRILESYIPLFGELSDWVERYE
jgi:nucleotidyltransferase substrate binding protein (TIGR01987 family)